MRMLKRHKGCHFSSGVGAWAPELHMATALDKSTHFRPALLFVATTKAWENLNKCAKPKWKTNYDSGKQTRRRSLCDWRTTMMRFGLELHVATAPLEKSAHCRCFPLRRWRPKLERSWGNCAKPKWKQIARLSKTWRRKPCFWRTKSSSLIADQISAPVLSAPTDLLREQIHWSTAPTVLGLNRQNRKIERPTRALHLIWVRFWGQIERAPGNPGHLIVEKELRTWWKASTQFCRASLLSG